MIGRITSRLIGPLVIIAIGLLIWQVLVRYHDTPMWFLPAPTDIAKSLWNDRSLLAHDAWITLKEVVIGYLLAVLLGVGLAVLIHFSVLLERAIYPLVIASQAVPVIVLAPLLLVWFGYGMAPKIIVVTLIAFFPITVGAVDGLRSADRETLDLLRSYGAGKIRRFWMAQAPSAMPGLFSGAKIGASVAVIGAVFGEYVGANDGLGYLINISSARLRTDRVFAAIAVLAVMAIALFLAIALIERRVLRWRRYMVQ